MNSRGLQQSANKLVMLLPDQKNDIWMINIWLIAYFLTCNFEKFMLYVVFCS